MEREQRLGIRDWRQASCPPPRSLGEGGGEGLEPLSARQDPPPNPLPGGEGTSVGLTHYRQASNLQSLISSRFPLPAPRSTFFALRFPLPASRSTFFALRSPLPAPRSPFFALRSPLPAPRSPLFALLLLLLLAAPARAADPWPTLTARDGLAATPALALAAAPDGALWVGGLHGVSRWDGRTAEAWSKADGLGDDWVTSLAATPDAVWAATWGGGVSRYDPAATEHPWRTLSTADGLPSDLVTSLAAAPDGALWVGTYGGGLARVRDDTVEAIAEGPASPWITALTIAPNGDLWVGTSGEGVARRDARGWTTFRAELPDPAVRSLGADRDGRVYVGTATGLAVYAAGAWRTFGRADGLPDPRVLALSQDSQGTMWAGTADGLAQRVGDRWQAVPTDALPSRYVTALAPDRGAPGPAAPDSPHLVVATPGGVSLPARQLPPPPERLPVVLVHGWRGPPFATVYDSEARFLKTWLAERGQPIFYAQGIDSNQPLYTNAAALRDAIADVRQQTGASKVHLVGHSMGGLVSRAYLESTLYQGDVASLTTLGSPHAGADQWRDYLLREIGPGGSREPSARELLPESVAVFNGLGQPPADVPYYLLGGDITAREGLEKLDFWPPTDGIVTQWSALSLDGPGVTRLPTQDLHGWGAGSIAAGIPSYLWPDHNYRAYLRAIFDGQSPRVPPDAPALVAGLTPPVAPPRTPYVSGELRPGATVTATLTLDATPGARVLALWQRGDVTTTLTSPAGVTYRERSGDGVDYFGFATDTFANVAAYRLDEPAPGPWTLSLAAAPDTPPTTYGIYAELDGAPRLAVTTDARIYAPGAPIRLTARLAPASLAQGATVTADLYAGGQVATSVTLRDDGRGADDTAGDGVYHASIAAPSAAEVYPILVTARGANGAFERGASAVVAVRSDRARLAGPATGRVASDGVVVDVPVEVRSAGPLAVAVRAQAGGREARAVQPAGLAPGLHTVSVPLRGVSGDAVVTGVTLYDATTALIPLDQSP